MNETQRRIQNEMDELERVADRLDGIISDLQRDNARGENLLRMTISDLGITRKNLLGAQVTAK